MFISLLSLGYLKHTTVRDYLRQLALSSPGSFNTADTLESEIVFWAIKPPEHKVIQQCIRVGINYDN